MQNPPSISDSEWEVMNIFWQSAGPLMAGDVVRQLAETRTWSPRTVKTLLNRLIKKGALNFDPIGKSYQYRPAIGRDQCVRAASRSFLSRVFGGSAGPLLVHFVTHTDLSATEMEELQRLLREKKPAAKRQTKG